MTNGQEDDDEAELPPELRFDVDLAALPPALAERVLAFGPDDETRRWYAARRSRRHGRLASVAHRLFTTVFSDFDVNGFLGMYDMFLGSTAQWAQLVGDSGGRLLDVGAGDGAVTARLATCFDEVVTTERSPWLARRLRRRGYRCHIGDLADLDDRDFDAVALLNVIDRVHDPAGLVDEAVARLRPGGRLLLATPLPLDAFVFEGPRTVSPRRPLRVGADRWEAALTELVEVLLTPKGLTVERVARLPYLSRGDHRWALYARDDVVIVAKRSGA